MIAAGGRHLSWPNLLEYLNAGAPAMVRISGTPDRRPGHRACRAANCHPGPLARHWGCPRSRGVPSP